MDQNSIQEQVKDLRRVYAKIFCLMRDFQDESIQKESSTSDLASMNAEIARRMQIADGMLRPLLKSISNNAVSANAEFNEFLDLLDAGLNSMKNQLNHQMAQILHEQKRLAESIRLQQKQRLAMRSASR